MSRDIGVNRRSVIKGIAAGSAVGVAGCIGGGNNSNGNSNSNSTNGNGSGSGNGNSNGASEFTAWSFGPNFAVLKKATKAWEKNHNVRISVEELDGGTKPWTSALQVQSGLPGYGLIQYPAYRSAARSGGLENVNDIVYPNIDKLIDSAVSATHVDGNFFAFPHSINPVTLIYNKSLFEKAGLPGNPEDLMSEIKVYDDLIQAGKQMEEKTDAKLLAHGAQNIRPPNAMLTQFGGGFYNSNGKFEFDQPPNVEVMKILKKLQPYGANLDLFGNIVWKEFRKGNVASFLVPGWYIEFIQENLSNMSGEWRMAQLPAPEKNGPRGATSGGAPETIPVSKSEGIKNSAKKFGKFRTFTEQSFNRKMRNFIFPANTVQDADVLSKEVDLFGGQTIFQEVQKTLKVSPPQDSAPSDEVDSMYQEAYRKIMKNDAPIEKTLKQANKQMLDAIDDADKERMTVEEVRNQAKSS